MADLNIGFATSMNTKLFTSNGNDIKTNNARGKHVTTRQKKFDISTDETRTYIDAIAAIYCVLMKKGSILIIPI